MAVHKTSVNSMASFFGVGRDQMSGRPELTYRARSVLLCRVGTKWLELAELAARDLSLFHSVSGRDQMTGRPEFPNYFVFCHYFYILLKQVQNMY